MRNSNRANLLASRALLDRIDTLNDSVNREKSPSTLERRGFTVALFSLIVSSFFACLSVKLQCQANNNTDAIDTLTRISNQQIAQLAKIDSLLEGQGLALSNIQQILQGVNGQYSELIQQTGIMNQQSSGIKDGVTLNRIELKKSNYSDSLTRLAFRNRLAVRLRQMIRLMPIAYPPHDSLYKRILIVKGTVDLLMQETDNVFLMEKTDLFEQWDDFRRKSESNLARLNLNPSLPLDGRIFNMNNDPIEKVLDKYFLRFWDDWGEFDRYFRFQFFNKYNIKY